MPITNCKLSIVICTFLGLLAWSLIPSTARADLDPELEKPYRIQIVVHVAPNRFLTPTFHEKLHGALRDELGQALGPMARVEVLTAHPLLPEIEIKGLESGLNGWEQLSGVQTHFVLVDFAGGIYTIKSRYYDGMTGLVSPTVRAFQTTDRTQVSRVAVRLIEENFGLVGTVTHASGKGVDLAIKGGKLADASRGAARGDVFAISRITREGDRLRGRRVDWALVEVLETQGQGTCRCRLWHRYVGDDLREEPGVLGYRCLKIATTTAALRIQLIDENTFQPLASLPLQFRKPRGGKPGQSEDKTMTNRGGVAVSHESYHGFVLVDVLSGGNVQATLPVAITGADVVARYGAQTRADAHVYLELRQDQWLRRILDNLWMAAERFDQLNGELAKSLDGTLAIARPALKNMISESAYLHQEHDTILREAKEKSANLDLRDGEQGLIALSKKTQDLTKHVADWEKLLKDATSPEKLAVDKMLQRAALLEGEANFDEAIALYEKALQARPNEPKVEEHLAKLKGAWAVKSPKHEEARVFLTKTWPTLDVSQLGKNLDKAMEALVICKKVEDRLTPLRVKQANVVHYANIAKRLDALKRQDNADNRAQAEAIRLTIESLRRVHSEATAIAGKKE